MTLAPAAGSLVRVCGGWLLVQTCEDITAKRQHTRGFSWYCADVSVWLLGQTGLHLSI